MLSTIAKQATTANRILTNRITAATAFKRSITTLDSINQRVVNAQYAVRGELVIRADALRTELQRNPGSLPFKEIVACNIGNPHELGQQPITYFRQVLSILHYPQLIKDPNTRALFPTDVIQRAERYLANISGGTGAYTSSVGLKIVRDEIAAFIGERDGYPADPDSIFLSDGASSSVKAILQLLIKNTSKSTTGNSTTANTNINIVDGIMTPIPQYPLYSASLTLFGGAAVQYELDESNNWGLSVAELEKSLATAKSNNINVRAIVIINPGNPTGQCLPHSEIVNIIQFAERHSILIMADEVYQTNIYSNIPFNSFKSVVRQLNSKVELVSFHSVSKGFLGECGLRGGYMELVNLAPAVAAQISKLASISLCSNITGQIMTGLMCQPPKINEPSYQLYSQERDSILASLKRRAVIVAQKLNELEGIHCNTVEGALYAFPSITLPPGAITAAAAVNKQPDVFYCLALLEATGIVVVPGSGFGQKLDTYHFRTTILPSESSMNTVMNNIKLFHTKFMKQYSNTSAAAYTNNSNNTSNNPIDSANRIKQLLYRSKQRGWLELDLILGSWAEQNLSKLTAIELNLYESIISAENTDLIKYIVENQSIPQSQQLLYNNPILKSIIQYTQSDKGKQWIAKKGNQ